MQDDISQAAEPQTATRHTGTTTRPSLLAERTSPRRTIPSKSLVRACTACRRMKMKCEGASNPPCTRCLKAGRACLSQLPKTLQNIHFSPSITTENDLQPEALRAVETSRSPVLSNSLHASAHQSRAFGPTPQALVAELPSIFSTSPVDIVIETSPQTSSSKRRLVDGGTISATLSPLQAPGISPSIPLQDLADMLHMFRERLLPHILFFEPEDFMDIDGLLHNNDLLTCCACLVVARFLPDSKATQQALASEVSRIIKNSHLAGSENAKILYLKCLMMLYVFSIKVSPTPQAADILEDGELQYWALKFRVETFALHLSLHSSVYQLEEYSTSYINGTLTSTIGYQKYILWLQLFLMSHFFSIVCRTPPSIRIDSSIRMAPRILGTISSPSHSRILAEIELCLIWDEAGLHHPPIAEWWCPPGSANIASDTIESVLLKADRSIDEWYGRWKDYIQSSHHLHSLIMDYHGRFTRFYISSYAIRSFRITNHEMQPFQRDQIRRCTTYATKVLDLLTNLRPIQKDRLRYLPASSSTMVSFCCHFLVSACQAFPAAIANEEICLDQVAKLATLLQDLALDSEQKFYVQGSFILKRVNALRSERQQSYVATSAVRANSRTSNSQLETWSFDTSGAVGFDLNQHMIEMDDFWDFNMLYATNIP